MADSVKPFSDEEIIVCLETFCNVPVTADQLKAPTAAFLHNVLECFMKDLQLNLANTKLPFKCLQMLESQDYYEASIPLVMYFSVVKELLGNAGITDLSIKDLMEPKPKRTKKILSYLITMWKHLLTKFQKFNMINDDMISQREEKERVFKKLTDLQENLEALKEKRLDPVEKENILRISAEKKKKMKDLEVEKESIHQKHTEVKSDITEVKKNISDLNVEIITEKEKLSKLADTVLKSPDRLSSELNVLKNSITEANNDVLLMRKKVQDAKEEVSVLGLKLEGLKNVNTNMEKSIRESKLVQQDAALIVEFDEAIKLSTKEIQTEGLEKVSFEKEIAICEQQIDQLEQQMKTNVDSLQQLQTVILRRIDQEAAVSETLSEQDTEIKEELAAINKEFSEQDAAAAEIHRRKMKQFVLFEDAFNDYMKEFDADADAALKMLNDDSLGKTPPN